MKHTEKLQWRVHVPGLFEEILCNPSTAALRIPLNILSHLLAEVGKRAAEINDLQLNALMMRLTIYSAADPKNKDYNPGLVKKTIAEAKKAAEKPEKCPECGSIFVDWDRVQKTWRCLVKICGWPTRKIKKQSKKSQMPRL